MSPANPESDRPVAAGRPGPGGSPGAPSPAPAEPPPPPAGLPPVGATPATHQPPGTAGPGPAGLPESPYPWAPGGPVPPRPPRRPGREVATVVVGVLAISVLGVPLGLLWRALAPEVTGSKVSPTQLELPQPEQLVAADGWFSILGLAFGVVVSVLAWMVLRRQRGPVGLLTVALGGIGAGVVAWQTGRRIGLAGYHQLAEAAPVGQLLSHPPDLRAGGVDRLFGVLPVLPWGDLLLPAFGAVITYTLLAGWSRWPSLRAEPAPAPVSLDLSAGPTP